MKFTLERAALLKSLGHVQSVVERRNTIPILANVLIRAAGQNVSFAATDMEIEINETTEGSVGKAGAVTAPAHTLYEIVRKLPEGAQVSLEGGEDAGEFALGAHRFPSAQHQAEAVCSGGWRLGLEDGVRHWLRDAG